MFAALGSFLAALLDCNLNSIIYHKVTPFIPHSTKLYYSVILIQLLTLLSALQIDLVDDMYYFLSVMEP